MLKPLFDIAPLLQPISSGALIITANNRLANKVRQAWGQYQLENNKTCWQQPEVFALETWIQNDWQELCDRGYSAAANKIIVTPQQEQYLWEAAIGDDNERPDDLTISTSARHSMQAYRIVQQWQISDDTLAAEATLLLRWITLFRKRLAQHQAMTFSDCADELTAAYKTQSLSAHKKIVLVGFQTLPPIYQSLLESAGKETESLQSLEPTEHCVRTSLHDESQELLAAAKWARQRLHQTPKGRIGVVIPDLTRLRPVVDRIFREQLQENYRAINGAIGVPPFNISAGTPLADTPVIHCALLLLSLNRKQLPLADYCQLLNSPFWGDSFRGEQQQLELRAKTEIRLRELAKYELRPAELRYWLHHVEARAEIDPESEQPDIDSSYLSGKLEQFETLRKQAPKKASFSDWMQLFSQQLACVIWPGARSLSSIEYQQMQHWHNALAEMIRLDQVATKVSCHEALQQLTLLLGNIPFQPETPDEAVQILGVLEATGLRFDHLWIMGMDDRKWPQPCQYNPLLPVSLQRHYHTPRSRPENELELAQEQLALFKQNADDIVFSHSRYEGEQELRVSNLITGLPDIPLKEILPAVGISSRRYSDQPATLLTEVDCTNGPALETTDKAILGGTGILEAQAACPFNAFARYRLGASQPPEPTLGLSAMDRGSVLHNAMEIIWRRLDSQEELLGLSETALDSLISEAIDTALQPLHQTRRELMTPGFTALEKQRLQKLILAWLDVEKERPPFQVAELESRHEVTFSDLPLSLRIDRIDETADGKQIIIDYKTGKTDIRSWFGERPAQPQLPLYALTSEKKVAAISFAEINIEKQAFAGVGENPSLLPELTATDSYEGCESWPQLQSQWQEKLEYLAQEFKTGCADVTFYNRKAIEWQSELLPLNRWYGFIDGEPNDDEQLGDEPPGNAGSKEKAS